MKRIGGLREAVLERDNLRLTFLESPGFTLSEVTLDGKKWLLVHHE